jgi:hypothetical protein
MDKPLDESMVLVLCSHKTGIKNGAVKIMLKQGSFEISFFDGFLGLKSQNQNI